MSVQKILEEFRRQGSAEDAAQAMRYFKTGKGEYGEGDHFLGIRVPVTRKFARQLKGESLDQLEKILHSGFHEERLLALLTMVEQFARADEKTQKRIYQTYLRNTAYVNNWDLVDSSSHKIVGEWLFSRERKTLFRLARSKSLWDRRIAIMATLAFIKRDDFEDTFKLSEVLLNDKEDLIHKATGWMLREVGNRDKTAEEQFLNKYAGQMPRTMLRYAIEKFPKAERKYYMEQ